MASDAKKRQKKRERQTAKRSAKKHELLKERSTGLLARMAFAARYPVLHCRVTNDLDHNGMGWVLLSRQFPDGRVAAVVFLVDRYCMGVKRVVADVSGHIAYADKFLKQVFSPSASHAIEPADARKLIDGSVAFAVKLGLTLHPDYAEAIALFGSIDAAQSTASFEFGKDGKPFFISGPNDSFARCNQIMAILAHHCGPDGYHYMLRVRGSEEMELGEPVQLPRAIDAKPR